MINLMLTLHCVGALVFARPSIQRSRQQIHDFSNFLESIRTNDGLRLEQRMAANPNVKEWENSGYFEGDILLNDKQVRSMVEEYSTGKNAYLWPDMRWPHNTIIYEFGVGEFSDEQRDNILAAVREIEANTCLKFRIREPEESAYVRLTGGPNGCYANVGFHTDLVHTMNLASGCFLQTTIIHEWMHIIGFFHMQSTYNRDDYVQINWDNIIEGQTHNFEKYGRDKVSNLGVPYDYASVMHYSANSFSSNGLPTIVALHDEENTMGQNHYVSDKDWLRINRFYECEE